MIKRWRAEADARLDDVLERVFHDPTALEGGRVFVDRTRITDPAHRVPSGALVEVGAALAQADVDSLSILHHEADFVVANKPAGLVSVPDHHGHDSLQARVAAHCKLPLESVHPTSRLDRGVSGVVVFALSKAARDGFAEARAQGHYSRLYLAVAARAPDLAPSGEWNAPIGRSPRDPRRRAAHGADSAQASTHYRVLATAEHGALLALSPRTGRTHQLRVHAAHAGVPLDGDGDYGGRTRIVSERGDILTLGRIALHALRVEVPWSGRSQRFEAPVPESLCTLWRALGGAAEAWDLAHT